MTNARHEAGGIIMAARTTSADLVQVPADIVQRIPSKGGRTYPNAIEHADQFVDRMFRIGGLLVCSLLLLLPVAICAIVATVLITSSTPEWALWATVGVYAGIPASWVLVLLTSIVRAGNRYGPVRTGRMLSPADRFTLLVFSLVTVDALDMQGIGLRGWFRTIVYAAAVAVTFMLALWVVRALYTWGWATTVLANKNAATASLSEFLSPSSVLSLWVAQDSLAAVIGLDNSWKGPLQVLAIVASCAMLLLMTKSRIELLEACRRLVKKLVLWTRTNLGQRSRSARA